jgi:hypothetical protein
MLDYAVIMPRLQRVYEWPAEELGEPRLLELLRDGKPIDAWPLRSGTSGLRACRWQAGSLNAPLGPGEARDRKG